MAGDAEREGAAERAGVSATFARFFRRAPRQARSRAAVDAMLSALEEQLARDDQTEEWTLEALAARAGVGIGSFYEYFSGKDSILGALVGEVTERNYKHLLAVLDAALCDSLDHTVTAMASEVARTYLGKPRTTRVVVTAIGRLGLGPAIVLVRDRFAVDLAARVQRFFPGAREADLAETLRIVNDAVMGMIAGELVRSERPDVETCGKRFAELTMAMLRGRHGEPRGVAAGEIPGR